jgi:hypothetical protein
MTNNSEIKIYDGDYEIMYSADFNIYENKLTLSRIAGFSVEFLFEKDPTVSGSSSLKIEGDDKIKKVVITLINFDNVFGAGTTKKIPIIKTKDKQIFFSVHSKSLNEESSFLKVSVTFYIK